MNCRGDVTGAYRHASARRCCMRHPENAGIMVLGPLRKVCAVRQGCVQLKNDADQCCC